MKSLEEVERLIRARYPSAELGVRAIPCRQLRTTLQLANVFRSTAPARFQAFILEDNRIPHLDSKIAFLFRRHRQVDAIPRLLDWDEYESLERGGAFDEWKLVIGISLVGPYYYVRWQRRFSAKAGFGYRKPADVLPDHWRQCEADVNAEVEAHGFQRLSEEELEHPLPWMSPGETTVPGIPDVYSALFSAE